MCVTFLIPHDKLVTAIALEAGVDHLAFIKKQKFNTWVAWTLKRRGRYVETPPSPLAPCPRLPQSHRRNESERGPDGTTPWSSLLLIQGGTGATCVRGSPRFQCDSPTGFTVSPVLFQPTLPALGFATPNPWSSADIIKCDSRLPSF